VPTSLEVKLLALFVKEAAVGVDPTRFEQQSLQQKHAVETIL
jgi:hypothetical protein